MRDARAGRSKQSQLGCATVRFTQPNCADCETKEGDIESDLEFAGRQTIIESLKAQLKTLEGQRRQHEKATNALRRNEVKIRKALSFVASLPPVCP
jgi:hypothetical protein